MEPYVSIPGQLTIEGQELPAPEWNRLHVFLNLSSAGRRLTDTSYGAIGGQSAFNPNGAFTINNVMGGEYRLYFMSPPNYYIKEARYNGADVLNGPLRVSSSTPGDLAIVLSSKTGTIAGTVIDFQGQPGRGVQAILIPDEHRDRSDLYRTSVSIDDRPVQVIQNAAGGDAGAKLYFDNQSGLLVRQVRYVDTAVGVIPTRIDYSDYRTVAGVKVPFRRVVTWTDGRSTIELSEVQPNVRIEAAKFATPAPPTAKPATR
ncbi:MAG: hypothetical protein DMG97_42485 [Acidobacteria bacterium]|nr:MAG: hypothetical protein DMG97_42485 [Acidobacteriota bacterium]